MTYSVELTVSGAVYAYPSGPKFKNYFVTNPAPGIYNFHYGDALAAEADVHNLGAHHIKLVENGVTLLDADNDRHGWNQEWTHRTGAFVLHKSPDQIVAADLLPPYGPNGNRVGAVQNFQFKAGAFFDNAGVTIYMPTTGERADIGMVTDPAGLYMLTGQSGPMLAWGRAGGSCPNHWRDAATGLTVSIVTYAGINAYDLPGYQGDPVPGTLSPYVWKGPRDPVNHANYPVYVDEWSPQTAHYCDMHYVAAISTHDPVFLKDLQDAAAFTLGASAEIFLPDGRRVQAGEYRGVAHGLGMSIKARAATIDAEKNGWFVPGYHTPSPYYDATLAPSLIYYTGKAATNPSCARFNVLPQGSSTLGPWQHAFLVMDTALAVLTKAPGCEPMFIFALKNTVARFSGKSGWPPAWSGYYLDLHADDGSLLADWGAVFDQFHHGEQQNAATAAAHGVSYTPAIDTATYNKLKNDPINSFVILGTPESLMTDRAGLVFADYLEKLGLCNVRAQIPDFDAALANVEAFFHKYGSVNPRVALADPGVIPPVVIPPSPPTNPPPTEIHMPSETKIKIGETKVLAVTTTPADADMTGLAARAVPEGLVTLEIVEKGVAVTRVAKGLVKIQPYLIGDSGQEVSTEGDALDAVPLPHSLAASWIS